MTQELISLTSESLEASYRALTPSQEGFTQDLMASNTIIPVIQLGDSTSGSSVPEYQSQAWSFDTTNATAENNTTTLINQTGFWKCFFSVISVSNNNRTGTIQINDGSSTKTLTEVTQIASYGNVFTWEAVIFLAAGMSIEMVSSGTDLKINGSCRQIADLVGTVVNPTGFTPQ